MTDERLEKCLAMLRSEGDYDPSEDMIRDRVCREASEVLSEQATEITRLRECMKRAGLQCFMREGTPEQVAAHMESVSKSYIEAIGKKNNELMFLSKCIADLRDQVRALTGAAERERDEALAALQLAVAECEAADELARVCDEEADAWAAAMMTSPDKQAAAMDRCRALSQRREAARRARTAAKVGTDPGAESGGVQ